MREILFRGKSLKTGEWTQGYLFRCWERAYILWGMVNDNADMTEVDPETVCQYTGLTDKNGRKIFEGDILKENIEDPETTGTDKFIYTVQYSDDHCAFTTSDVINEGYFEPLGEYINENVEVIGNIFDNPELIGENNG